MQTNDDAILNALQDYQTPDLPDLERERRGQYLRHLMGLYSCRDDKNKQVPEQLADLDQDD